MDYAILALDDVFDTGLSTLLDTFAMANELAAKAGVPTVRFNTPLVGVRPQVCTARGLRTEIRTVTVDTPAPAHVVVPAVGARTPRSLPELEQRPDIGQAQRIVAAWARRGTTIASACSGTFVLAGSGVLDGRRVTTSWWLAPAFRQRFSKVVLEQSATVVDDGDVVTAGASLAHVDLALMLIARRSRALATMTARYLLADERRSQSAYAIADHLQHNDPLVRSFEQWVRTNIGRPLSMEAAARAVGTSPRSLERRVRSALGCSPIRLVQTLRVEMAVERLRTTDDDLVQIASSVGYQEAATLRRLIRRRLGKSVRDFRRPSARGRAQTP